MAGVVGVPPRWGGIAEAETGGGCAMTTGYGLRFQGVDSGLTLPLVAFSWLLLPVTLKATLLGVLLLTSMVPAERW